MDFVVFGFGLGAILMLVGFALRDLGPWLFGSVRHDEALPEFEGVKSTIRKQTLSSIGNAISVAGAGVAAVTFSALLSKADDDLGAIVVGMSLVLAAVGVGAWTYDVFRRYRAALDIVAAQEQAARQRMAPRQKRRRPKPAPVAEPRVEPMPSPSALVDEADEPLNDAPVATHPEHEIEPSAVPNDLDEPLPAWDTHPEEPEVTPDDAPAEHETTAEPVPTPVEAPRVSRLSPDVHPRTRDAQKEELNPEVRAPDSERLTPEPVQLPPLPDLADDALIDEAVRLEPRQEPKRSLPSWLFEDLETDLATSGPSQAADPIDQFQEAKPVIRPSALDRLLSEDGAGEDQSSGPGSMQSRRPARRDDD